MLLRRLDQAPIEEWHRLRARILMDAGELGSRNLSLSWIEVPAGVEANLRAHEESEQAYVVVRGTGRMTVAGDTGEIAEGDVILVPPATDHAIENPGSGDLALVSVQSPPVASGELYDDRMAEAAGYDDGDDY
ncbi:MAG: cupin domain-containing protein [Solirubrobacterales bacterium]